jgi:hypothetical protein
MLFQRKNLTTPTTHLTIYKKLISHSPLKSKKKRKRKRKRKIRKKDKEKR